MDIDKLTVGEVREIAGLLGNRKETPFEVGKAYLIRTVTHHHVGRVKRIVGDCLVLEDASWVADDGRYQKALAEGTLSEVEPVPGDYIVGLGGLIDAAEWNHDLPRAAI